MNLYHRALLDHYHNPRNKGSLKNPTISTSTYSNACGDRVVMQATIAAKQGTIEELVFDGNGCIISQAIASKLTERLKGMSVESVLLLNSDYIIDALAMPLGPTRLECALLPLYTLQKGIVDYQNTLKYKVCSIDQK